MYKFLVVLLTVLILSCLYVFRRDKNVLRALLFAFGVLLGIGLVMWLEVNLLDLIRTLFFGPGRPGTTDNGYPI